MCPVLCDNCVSTSPSATSNAPSTNPTVSPITCVGLKESGVKFPYTRYTSADINKKEKTGKKCKHLADENEFTIKNNCANVIMDSGLCVADYCKVTCDNCDDDSAVPSISVTEPKCDPTDNDNIRFDVNHSSGNQKGCKWLRKRGNVARITECCETDKDTYLHCKNTCSSCD